MACSVSTVKWLLFCLTTVLGLCGLIITALGAGLAVIQIGLFFGSSDTLEGFVSDLFIALIVVGIVLFIVSIFGCYGICLKSHCMLVTFAIFLALVLIAEIVIGVIALVNKDAWDKQFENKLREKFYTDDEEEINTMQKDMECCGFDGPKYWQDPPHRLRRPPLSCCKNPDDCSSWSDTENVYQAGCKQEIQEFINTLGVTSALLVILFAVIEIIVIIFSGIMANSLKNELRGQIYAPGYH